MMVQFENHIGDLDQETNQVTFYGITFGTICDAVPFLKRVDTTDTNFSTWYYRNHKGVETCQGMIYVSGKWFTNDDEAEYYIDRKYGGRRQSTKNPIFAPGDGG